jgi:hypothetical protein
MLNGPVVGVGWKQYYLTGIVTLVVLGTCTQ